MIRNDRITEWYNRYSGMFIVPMATTVYRNRSNHLQSSVFSHLTEIVGVRSVSLKEE